MKHLSRALLKLMTLCFPVVIAACYGPAYRYSKDGKVIDKETHLGIAGIKVDCVLADGTVQDSTTTSPDGSFSLSYDIACSSLAASDVDGELNGKYKPATLVDNDSAMVSILMEKEQ
jgi:hypothetical protein